MTGSISVIQGYNANAMVDEARRVGYRDMNLNTVRMVESLRI
jgi:hypothetical protein